MSRRISNYNASRITKSATILPTINNISSPNGNEVIMNNNLTSNNNLASLNLNKVPASNDDNSVSNNNLASIKNSIPPLKEHKHSASLNVSKIPDNHSVPLNVSKIPENHSVPLNVNNDQHSNNNLASLNVNKIKENNDFASLNVNNNLASLNVSKIPENNDFALSNNNIIQRSNNTNVSEIPINTFGLMKLSSTNPTAFMINTYGVYGYSCKQTLFTAVAFDMNKNNYPESYFTATVDFGDNTTPVKADITQTPNTSQYIIKTGHTYKQNGNYNVVLILSDNNLSTSTPAIAQYTILPRGYSQD